MKNKNLANLQREKKEKNLRMQNKYECWVVFQNSVNKLKIKIRGKKSRERNEEKLKIEILRMRQVVSGSGWKKTKKFPPSPFSVFPFPIAPLPRPSSPSMLIWLFRPNKFDKLNLQLLPCSLSSETLTKSPRKIMKIYERNRPQREPEL